MPTEPRPRKRLSRQESQTQTRERLLAAAKALFIKQGFGGASLRDIAEEAGYSQGAFYSNFESKEAVLLELLKRHMEEEAEQLSAALDQVSLSRDQLLKRLDGWADTLNRDADWSMLAIELQLHANRSPTFANQYMVIRKAHQKRLGDVLMALFETLELVLPAPAEDVAAGFMAMANGLAIGTDAKGTNAAGKLIMVFLRGLLAAAEQAKA